MHTMIDYIINSMIDEFVNVFSAIQDTIKRTVGSTRVGGITTSGGS